MASVHGPIGSLHELAVTHWCIVMAGEEPASLSFLSAQECKPQQYDFLRFRRWCPCRSWFRAQRITDVPGEVRPRQEIFCDAWVVVTRRPKV